MDTKSKQTLENEWNEILYDGILPKLYNVVEQFIRKEKKAQKPFIILVGNISAVVSLYVSDLYGELGFQIVPISDELYHITRRILQEKKPKNIDRKVVVAYVNSLAYIVGYDRSPYDDDLDKILEILQPYKKPISDSEWNKMYKRLFDDYKKIAKAHDKW